MFLVLGCNLALPTGAKPRAGATAGIICDTFAALRDEKDEAVRYRTKVPSCRHLQRPALPLPVHYNK